MDPRLRDYSGSFNGIAFDNSPMPFNMGNEYVNGVSTFGNPFAGNGHSSRGSFHPFPPDLAPNSLPLNPTPGDFIKPVLASSNLASTTTSSNHTTANEVCAGDEDWHDDYDFSDSVLSYINQILMEEDVENKGCMLQECLELQAAEKSLYDVIGKKYPPSPDPVPSLAHRVLDFPDNGFPGNQFDQFSYENYMNGSADNHVNLNGDASLRHCNDGPLIKTPAGYHLLHSSYGSSSSNSSSNCVSLVNNGHVDSPLSTCNESVLHNGIDSFSSLFIKGAEEASKFLPDSSDLTVTVDTNGLSEEIEGLSEESEGPDHETEVKLEEKEVGDNLLNGSTRGRKHLHEDTLDLAEERTSKQAAVYSEPTVRSDMFDKVLLSHAGDKNEAIISLRESLQTAARKKEQQNVQSKGSSGGKGRGRKQSGKKEVVDLRTLLISCAQAVAADDRRTASELLKQLRQHSSELGDGNQRLAHCLADGLEARMAGTGSQIYKALTSKRTSAADVLKAYLLYLAACPFRKLSQFFSNKTIANLTRGAARIHIIDFGILYGFQWPTFIQCQARRPDGPPKIRITGIDFPQPGFRPAERVEETGQRLANYAEEFKVPFEYNVIAKKWETIQVEDLKLDKDEVLIVNCLYRLKNLPDETMMIDSSRNAVLNLMRKINPDVFINGVVNGAYNAPFFVTRFKEALFYFSSHFDMLETIVPRECDERLLIERDLLGREALNVVACEGWERIERPETYKQWQVRIMRAGFRQLPLDPEIKNRSVEKVRSRYHKDFVISQDNQWLLQGWKGRIVYALSTWKPA